MMARPAALSDPPPDFRRPLLRWYRKHGRDLPWRHSRDPYAILVSEFMLQQTQVATVIPYYIEWLHRFPDFTALAAAPESDVLHAWQGLGYYARARNLHATAKAVVQDHGGAFPRDPVIAHQLPGLGNYTANAVATFAFDQPVPIVEANIARVLSRQLDLRLPIDTTPGRAALWKAAAELVPDDDAGVFNSALMDLGAMVCVARQPKCRVCPVRASCRAKEPSTLPLKKPRQPLKLLTEDHAFAFRDEQLLLEQSADRWRGMWMLPRLTSRDANSIPLYSAQFPFTHHRITLAVFEHPVPPRSTHQWFPAKMIESVPMPSPHRRAVDALLSGVRRWTLDVERSTFAP